MSVHSTFHTQHSTFNIQHSSLSNDRRPWRIRPANAFPRHARMAEAGVRAGNVECSVHSTFHTPHSTFNIPRGMTPLYNLSNGNPSRVLRIRHGCHRGKLPQRRH